MICLASYAWMPFSFVPTAFERHAFDSRKKGELKCSSVWRDNHAIAFDRNCLKLSQIVIFRVRVMK